MEPILLVCKALHRDQFTNEIFTGEDDILALVERGSFVFDNGTGPQHVGPMEAVNFKRNVTYRRSITQPADLYLFRYRSDDDIFGRGKIIFQDVERIRSTLRLLHISDSTIPLDDFACKRTLFADLVNQYCLENAASLAENTHSDKIISASIAYLNNNLHEKINLNALAAQHYLSYVQFSRRFKSATGTTPQNYLANLRLKKAQHLLADSDLPIKIIAHDCGFSNEYYFSNFFRVHCTLSPTHYRTMIKTTDDTSGK